MTTIDLKALTRKLERADHLRRCVAVGYALAIIGAQEAMPYALADKPIPRPRRDIYLYPIDHVSGRDTRSDKRSRRASAYRAMVSLHWPKSR